MASIIVDESLLLSAIDYCSNEEIKSELKKSLYDAQMKNYFIETDIKMIRKGNSITTPLSIPNLYF